MDGISKFFVRPRPGDPWRGAEQREQEQMADLIAKASSHLQLPGLTIPAAGAGAAAGGGKGAAAAGAAAGAGAGTLPGGISIQQPGQQGQLHPSQVSPAGVGNMGPAPQGQCKGGGGGASLPDTNPSLPLVFDTPFLPCMHIACAVPRAELKSALVAK